MDIISELPWEVAAQIFDRLSAEDLLACAQVCRQWRAHADQEGRWKARCLARWSDKVGFGLAVTFPFWKIDFAKVPTSTLSQLSVKDLRSILHRRYVTHGHCIEKSDLLDAVRATTPPRSEFSFGPKGGMEAMWKASYFTAELDSRRRAISSKELCDFQWNFCFRWQTEDSWKIRFLPDYGMAGFPEEFNAGYTWKFHGSDCHIQVQDYPPLKVERTADDWGWVMYNQYALFWSGDATKFPQQYFRPREAYHHDLG